MKKFYHGTSQQNWIKIQKEGVLWGGWNWHRTKGKQGYRHTYLTSELDIAKKYGDIVLEIKYSPSRKKKGLDNYGFYPPVGQTCWQFAVYVPIPIKKVKVYENNKSI